MNNAIEVLPVLPGGKMFLGTMFNSAIHITPIPNNAT
jgi:hypothetical protein